MGPKGEELLPTAEERAERAEARIAELDRLLRERSK